MTALRYACPMDQTPPLLRNIYFITFPGFQILDVTGPMETFSKANEVSGTPQYNLILLAENSGPVQSNGPVNLNADRSYASLSEHELNNIDTLVISGGDGIQIAIEDNAFIEFIKRASQNARRVVSVCTGAFVLAHAGLLENRRCTTHWDAAEQLAQMFPTINVDSDAIYVQDGKFWTSAGVTAGIDLSLALIEEDLSKEVALEIARRLVVYMMRPGGQAQFSAQLKFQRPRPGKISVLLDWIENNHTQDLSVVALAQRCAMSERHFARRFTEEIGVTPAKFVEHSRLDHARRLLEQSSLSIEKIAHASGFGSAEILRRTFQRHLHLAPADYRQRFHTSLRHKTSHNP